MKSRIIPNSIQLPKDKLIGMVKTKFDDYINFINYQHIDFPQNIDFHFYNGLTDRKEFIGQVYVPDNDNQNYTLTLDQIDCITNKKDVVFHEFTHIMDYLIINKDLPFDEKLSTIRYISEIRATYIEYFARCNINQYDNSILLPSNTILFSGAKFKQITLDEEVICYQDKIIKCIQQSDKRNAKDSSDILVKLAYYMGFVLFIQKHTHIQIDSSNIIQLLSDRFGESVELFFNSKDIIPLNFSPIDIKILHLIKDIENLMINYYIEKFIRPHR